MWEPYTALKDTMASDDYLTVSIDVSYGKKRVLQCQGLTFPMGSVVGILGRNGAGKTTLLKCIAGLFPAKGVQWREETTLSALIETPRFRPDWTGIQHLFHQTRVYRCSIDYLDEVIQVLELKDFIDKTTSTYSLGQKQRLGIARALIPQPQCLILDEPTNGLDPKGIVDIRKLIRQLNSKGMNVILSSHLLTEIEACCTHLVVIQNQSIQYAGPLESYFKRGVLIQSTEPQKLTDWLTKHDFKFSEHERGLLIEHNDPAALNALCFEANIHLSHLEKYRGSIEDTFVEDADVS